MRRVVQEKEIYSVPVKFCKNADKSGFYARIGAWILKARHLRQIADELDDLEAGNICPNCGEFFDD